MNSNGQESSLLTTSIENNKKLNDKQTRRKLLQIPLNSFNKTMSPTQNLQKNLNIDNLSPIENEQFSINVYEAKQKLNELIQVILFDKRLSFILFEYFRKMLLT